MSATNFAKIHKLVLFRYLNCLQKLIIPRLNRVHGEFYDWPLIESDYSSKVKPVGMQTAHIHT